MTRVLIVDDNKANLYLLESLLKGNGLTVISASNGVEALALARKELPDLVITDILMPKMDGFELCRQWKADRHLKTIPFIFYTATYTDPRDEQFALGLGADRFLLKPMKPETLMEEVNAVLSAQPGQEPVPRVRPLGDEMEILRQYNEVLFRKLEKKVLQLEAEIEERKAAQQQLEAAVRELEQKNNELAQFTYTVSHELKSPLITIHGLAGLIEEDVSRGGDPADMKTHIHRITQAANTLNALLSDLLKLSRAGQCIHKPEPVDLGVLVHESAELFASTFDTKEIQFTVEEDLPVVNVDRARIREVFVNLIENAVKYRMDTGKLEINVGIDRSGPEPAIFVRDNGRGIDPQYLERIFNIFEKLDGKTEGTGVGLAIARRIVEAHGGRIWAVSEGEGKGTAFLFTLPVASGQITDTNNN